MFNKWEHVDVELDKCDRETIIKSFKLFVEWAEECGFDYDSLADTYENYKERLEDEEYEYVEGLLACALWEVLGEE